MKTISASLEAHLEKDVTTLCTCWRIERLDGVNFYFTNLDVDLEFPPASGFVYKAGSGLTRSNITSDSSFGVNNTDISGVFDSEDITMEDLQNGLFNYATVYEFMVNYEDLSQGDLKLSKTKFGEAKLNDTGFFTIEQRGITQALKQSNIIDTYTVDCTADLGDLKCKIGVILENIERSTPYEVGDLKKISTNHNVAYRCTVAGTTDAVGPSYGVGEGVTVVDGSCTFVSELSQLRRATVVAVDNNKKITVSGLVPGMNPVPTGHVESFFNGGGAIWVSGSNAGATSEIKTYIRDTGIPDQQGLELFLATHFEIQIGDVLDIYPGCNKDLKTCKNKFNNVENFRGFPHVPGPKFIPSNVPNAKA